MKVKEVSIFLNEKINTTTLGLVIRGDIRLIHSSQLEDNLNQANCILFGYEGQTFDGISFIESYCLYVMCVNKNSGNDITLVAFDLSEYSAKIEKIMKAYHGRFILNAGKLNYENSEILKIDTGGFLTLKMNFKISYKIC